MLTLIKNYIFAPKGVGMKHWPIIFLTVVAAILLSCEEDCLDCGVLNKEPFINLEFRAQSIIDTLETETDSLDSLIIVKNIELDSLTGDDSLQLANEIQELSTWNDSLKTSLRDFENGLVTVSITGDGANFLESFQDTTNNFFRIPLNMNADISEIYFDYFNMIDTLRLSYRREVYTTLDEVRIEAVNLLVDYHSFDSLSDPSCDPTECRSDEITYEAFF
ncbi:MAG TPA: hypothetical protein DDY13_13005 [Cytophagales bacterium]|jgi:hypothetical protein|nr:hypothetical protein [Cytophagales bacterium]